MTNFLKKRPKNSHVDEYIKINKAINRLEELERNGGRWIAVNRPHKNKKKYDRKRDRKIDLSLIFVPDRLCNSHPH